MTDVIVQWLGWLLISIAVGWLVAMALLPATGCWSRTSAKEPAVVVRWVERPACPDVEPPPFPTAPWFSACRVGALTWRGDPATGCMTRERQDAMGTFRLLYLEWLRQRALCPTPGAATSSG